MKSLTELCADIVAAQAKTQVMTPENLSTTLRLVFQSLPDLTQRDGQETTVDLATLRQNPFASLQRHQIICLECGATYQLLPYRHLITHGLTPRAYKQKWRIPQSQPLSSQLLTQRRRNGAKQSGTGAGLARWRAGRRQPAD